MSKPKILLQLDSDSQASVFDGVVAVDAGVEQLFRHHGVKLSEVRNLVYGAMFTCGPDELRNTAVFVGGSDVGAGEKMLAEVRKCFFGPMRVSVMLDSNGANTTASAAVLAAAKHVPLKNAQALVLAATGPVGSRVARLLAGEGAKVRVASRNLERAQSVADAVSGSVKSTLEACEIASDAGLARALDGIQILIAAGAPGVQLLSAAARRGCRELKVAIDLSAVPPLGLEGIEMTDRARERDGAIGYGAIGVGGTKMKIHKAAIKRLFESNDQVLDADEIYQIGKQMSA